jgi:hypothetical protein
MACKGSGVQIPSAPPPHNSSSEACPSLQRRFLEPPQWSRTRPRDPPSKPDTWPILLGALSNGLQARASWLRPGRLQLKEPSSRRRFSLECAVGNDLPWRSCRVALGARGVDKHPHGLGRRPRRRPGREGHTSWQGGTAEGGGNPQPRHGYGSLPKTSSHSADPRARAQVTVIASRSLGARLPGPVGHICYLPVREHS